MPIDTGRPDFRGKTMRHGAGRRGAGRFAVSGCRALLRGLAVAALLAAGGCAGDSIENAVPQAGTVTGPNNTGSYPNLNIPPQQAAEQFTNSEKSSKLSRLQAEQDAVNAEASAPVKTPNAAELDKLAKTHVSDTLKQIEGKCDPALDPTCK